MVCMKINKIIIGVGGNIYSENGSHPIEVCKSAINTLIDYSIKVERQSKIYKQQLSKCKNSLNKNKYIIF